MTDRLVVGTSSPTVQFFLEADEISNDPVANTHVVRCYLRAVNAGNTTTHYNNANASVSGSVNGNGFGVSGAAAEYNSGVGPGGTFWRYGPYDITVTGNADGTATASVALSVSYPSAVGTGGSNGTAFGLATLTTLPGVPTSCALAYNSDTQAALSWVNQGPSNGQPTSNQVQTSVNGAAFSQVASIATSTSLLLATAANQKVIAQVRETNAAGSAAWSASSNAVFTTPAAPSGVAAAKDASLNIVVSWTDNVAFTEHQHVVEHGTITGGVTTWDGSPLALVAAGTTSYTHATPNPAQVHVYRVSAKNTNTGALQSATVLSNSVQLLAAPNKPTLPVLPTNVDKAKTFTVTWTHNPADTTPQKYYEFGYSTNGGTTWSSTGKITSATSSKAFAANTYAAGTVLTVRVRTWGQATTGGSDGTGASPWSDTQAVTFKTRPVVTITSPANSSTWTQGALAVALGFSQAEGASFVQATIVLSQGATVLETLDSTTLASTALATRVANGVSYQLSVTVTDSNGLVSDPATSTFSVVYTSPVTAGLVVTYHRDSGIAQLDLTIPAAGGGLAAAVALTIQRTIAGEVETIVDHYAITGSTLTILDTTPVVNGTNEYTVVTYSVDGASATRVVDLTTTENALAFLSTGAGFATIVSFAANLQFSSAPSRALALVDTAGRPRPIALFGENGALDVSGSVDLVDEIGSSPEEVEAFVLTAGIVCYRDPSGRRVFGALTGSLTSPDHSSSTFQFKVSEAS